MQNIPKLIRQRPKSQASGQLQTRPNTVTFSNYDETRKLDTLDIERGSESSTSYYSRNDIKPMRSSLKSAKQNQRRCVSAAPILIGNNDKQSDSKTPTPTLSQTNNHDKSKEGNKSSNNNLSNNGSNSPGSSSSNEERQQSVNKESTSDYIDFEVLDSSRVLNEKTNNKHKDIKITRSVSSAATSSSLRPKSSNSISSTVTSDIYKKYYSVSMFNQFKNKLIDRKVYNQKQYENLDQVYNKWLHKPIPEDKKYIAGKYSLEMKRMNYANNIKKRQIFLAESLSIKKINLNIE